MLNSNQQSITTTKSKHQPKTKIRQEEQEELKL